MAHLAKLGASTDELVTALTGLSSKTDATKFNTHRESVLRTLRYQNYPRTNQFEVQQVLEGLEEKFRVYNDDDTADVLHQRLEELNQQSNRWTPEFLQLLLELSDRPVAKLQQENLEFLKPPEAEPEPRYRWEDLAAEDPLLRDKRVWRNIDYGAESSDDDGLSINSDLDCPALTDTESTTLSSFVDNESRQPEDFVASVDSNGLANIVDARFWGNSNAVDREGTSEGEVRVITELQAMREILFMLGGFPTSLFVMDEDKRPENEPSTAPGYRDGPNSIINPASGFVLQHASSRVFYDILNQLANFGNAIMVLRTWTGSKQTVPLLQCLQHEVLLRLRQFDNKLSNLQKKYVAPRRDVVVSLIDMQAELTVLIRPLVKTSSVIESLMSEQYAHAFRCLELLYDETCMAHMAGDDDTYEDMGTLFFDCFQMYLRPIRVWMEEGELRKGDNVFFISEATGETEPASLWRDRYKLRKTASGALHAPRFLHPSAMKIFNTGKSVVVLRRLGKYDRTKLLPLADEPKLDFSTVCGSPSISLAPFPDLLAVAFEQWIQSKHCVASSILQQCLFEDCGLRASLDALENIYFMTDGATTSDFTNKIFEKLDSGKSDWHDRFTLTELAQSTIGTLPGVTAERLRTSVSASNRIDSQKSRNSVKALSTLSLEYSLPWPIQIIIGKDTVPLYYQVFSFLLQIRRSTHMLESLCLGTVKGSADEKTSYYALRCRLLWFNSTLYGYLTDLVIRTNTSQMRMALAAREDVDDMIEVHQRYVRQLTNQALLGAKLEPIHKTIINILDMAIQLSNARLIHEARASLDPKSRTVCDVSSRRAEPRPAQQWLRRSRESDSSDDEYHDAQADLGNIMTAAVGQSYMEQLRQFRSQFDHLCKFVAQGLRSTARAGGEPNWDILADKLQNGIGGAA